MKPKYAVTLWALLFCFGLLYFIGTNRSIQNEIIASWIEPFKDLWANLFASLVIILFIDFFISKARLEKSDKSISYIKGRIGKILLNLIEGVKVPHDWKEKLENQNMDWKRFHTQIQNSINSSIVELEKIIDNYNYLIEGKLIDDIVILVAKLQEYYSYFGSYNFRFYFTLAEEAMFSSIFICQAKTILKEHDLLNAKIADSYFTNQFDPVSFSRPVSYNSENELKRFNELIKQANLFRDECKKLYEKGQKLK